MHMIGHDYDGVQTNARSDVPRLFPGILCGAGALARELPHSSLPKPMLENDVTGLAGEGTVGDCAEGDEKGGAGFLQVRQSAAIFVLGKESGIVGHTESA